MQQDLCIKDKTRSQIRHFLFQKLHQIKSYQVLHLLQKMILNLKKILLLKLINLV